MRPQTFGTWIPHAARRIRNSGVVLKSEYLPP